MSHMLLKADAVRLPLASKSVALVIGSPPYLDARTYLENGSDIGIARKCEAWVAWMLDVTTEALRVSQGLVLWVVAGKTEDWTYQPGPEGLLWEWWKRGGECSCLRPCYWNRVGIAGSGARQWYRADVEYILAFKRPGKLPYADPKANGHKPKWAPGGDMSHRISDGTRVNQWGKTGEKTGTVHVGGGVTRSKGKRPSHRSHTKRQADGTMREQHYIPPAIANPGNVLRVKVGGGQMGHPLAHENEAPYPVGVPEFFIRSHTKPGDTVLDCFSGSGSTGQAAEMLGRNYIGCDLRQSQCLLGKRRLERPHALATPKPTNTEPPMPLFSRRRA